MKSGRYILEGKIPVPCEDLLTWARHLEEHRKDGIVAQDYVGAYWVSTVFLWLDHNWIGDPPDLFETMVFTADGHDSVSDAPMWRTSTWELALEDHAEAVLWAKERQN